MQLKKLILAIKIERTGTHTQAN